MKVKIQAGGSVVIDGRTFTGKNIEIRGNSVVVDGVKQGGDLIGDVNVIVNGPADVVSVQSGTLHVNGDAGSVSTVSGDVKVSGNVAGNVSTTSGDVACGKVGGWFEPYQEIFEMAKTTIGTCGSCRGPVTLVTNRTPMYMCDQCGSVPKHGFIGEYGVVIYAEDVKRDAELAAINKAIAKVREMYDAYQKNSALFLDTPEAAVYKVLTALIAMAGEK